MTRGTTYTLAEIVIILALVISGCTVLQPAGVPSTNAINTSVAATVNALPPATATPATPRGPEATPTLNPTVIPPTEPPTFPTLSLAFVAPDMNAYAWNESLATPVQLTTSGDVQEAIISPDASRVLLVRSKDWVVYTLDIVNSNGTNMSTLIQPAGFDALLRPADAVSTVPDHVAWVHGSNLLAMSTRYTYDGPGYRSGESLFLVDSNNATMRVLLTIDSTWSWDYTFSPDGKKIAISDPEGINTYQTDRGGFIANVLKYPFVNTASEYAWVASPSWSADSSSLVAVVPPEDPWTTPLNNSSVWRVSSDGMSGELLFSAPMSYRPMQVASISPDLSRILYLVPHGAPEENRYALQLANIDGSDNMEYALGKIHTLPAWSTDSNKFYYLDELNGAFIGQAGMAPVPVPDFSQVRSVKWIDGQRFIGTSGPEGGWKLLLGEAGSPATVIYSTTTSDGQITFSINE